MAFFNRGVAYYNLKDNDSACKDWKYAAGYGLPEASTFFFKNCSDGYKVTSTVHN